MKHIFYICRNASDSLGLEKILHFYNVIAVENSDNIEDLSYSGVNTFVVKDLASKSLDSFVKEFSYGEKPFILSNFENATVKLSQLYDWEIKGIDGTEQILKVRDKSIIKFNVMQHTDHKIYGNVHEYAVKDFGKYFIEILDWDISQDYFPQIEAIVNTFVLTDESMTIECEDINGKLNVINSYKDILPSGLSTYTHAQIMNKEVPYILFQIYNDPKQEDKISFTDEFDTFTSFISQNHPYEISCINIKSKFETIIKSDMPSGVWKFGGDSTGRIGDKCISIYQIDEEGDKTLCLLHRGYSLYDIEEKEGIIINTRAKGINIISGDNIASIKLFGKSIDGNGNLFGWMNETIKGIIQYQMY